MRKHGSTDVALRPQKPQGSLGRGAQDGHLDFHTAPELCHSQIARTDIKASGQSVIGRVTLLVRVTYGVGKGDYPTAPKYTLRLTTPQHYFDH